MPYHTVFLHILGSSFLMPKISVTFAAVRNLSVSHKSQPQNITALWLVLILPYHGG